MSVRVETTSRAVTAYGGAVLLRETARGVGLVDAVDACLSLKCRARGLSEAEFVVGVADSIALGARCLDDLAMARSDTAQTMLRGFAVPAPQTAGRWLRRFTLGHLHQLNKALAEVQRNAYRAAGVSAVTLDFDSTYLFSRANVTYLCAVPFNPRIIEACRTLGEECWAGCVDKDEGEVAEFGYRLRDGKKFRRYIVKRIAIEPGQQATLEEGGYRHWVFVTNDHHRPAVELESEHRHKALVEAGMRELKSNYGLGTIRKHGFMANWAWLLLVCIGHNLCCWTQQLGRLAGGRDGGDLRAKRLRYRYLVVPALVVRSAPTTHHPASRRLRESRPVPRRARPPQTRRQHAGLNRSPAATTDTTHGAGLTTGQKRHQRTTGGPTPSRAGIGDSEPLTGGFE